MGSRVGFLGLTPKAVSELQPGVPQRVSASDEIKLLFLGSSPRDQDKLDLTGEFEELETQLASTSFVPRSRWDIPASKLPDLLDKYRPKILHFSGHGSDSGELLFVDEDRRAYAPDPDAVARVFAQHHGRVCCVVLNACFSEPQAQSIAAHVDVVIGISEKISDSSARAFTGAFYQALVRGYDVEAAFERAKLTLELGPERSASGLRLLRGSGPAPSEIVLVAKPDAAPEPTIPLTAHRYERTSAWATALAPRPDDRDQAARGQLRDGFRHMHERAATIAAESSREPAAHDLTSHLDALWELVDLIGGDSLSLTACEAFVLAGALLTHELGMTGVVSPGGRAELREQTRWRDVVAQRMRRKGTATPLKDVAEEADELVLRGIRADKVAELPSRVDFMVDEDLRGPFARLIGQLASSCWWPIDRLRSAFEKIIGPPKWCPPGWTIDPLRVACLLRAAHAAHVDDRRMPFWARMQQPTRQGEQLRFSASTPFTSDEAPSWWSAVDILRAIDGELRSVDALLQVTQRERLVARRVVAVDDLQALQRDLPTEGWEPVDTRVRINDIPALIERLGGRALYGNDTDAPLRELLQNAADAVRARRAHESRPRTWGRILVTRGHDEHGRWLEVRDNGLGMTRALLIGPLLEFGVSYWASDLSCEEFPGLHASGFRSVGEFGIGFFSVFMWGPKVRVTTRSCRAAQTWVLEFEYGLRTPPLLREARRDEHLVDGGTTVRVWLAEVEESPLAAKCEWLCPTLDVDVDVQEAGELAPTRVIVAGDWLTLDPEPFMQRIVGRRGGNLEQALTDSHSGDDDFELARVLAMLEPIVDSDTQEVVGRGCLRPPWLSKISSSALVTRGLRLGWSNIDAPILGVLEGMPSRAARDTGTLSVRPELLQSWYQQQETKIAASFDGFGRFEFASVLAPVMNRAITQLPVLWGRRGWTLAQLAKHGGLPPVIILVFPGAFTDMKAEMVRGSRREKPLADLPDHMFMLCSHLWLDLDQFEGNNPTLVALLGSIASAWQTDPTDMLKHSMLTRIADGARHPAINEKVWGALVHVLRQPGSSTAALESALRGFYEFAAKHPTARPLVQSRLSALGAAVQLEDRKRRRKE